MHAAADLLLPLGVLDPSLGLYSPTGQTTGGVINQKVVDGMIDIFYGRRPVSDFDQLVRDGRAAVAIKFVGELKEAYAATKG